MFLIRMAENENERSIEFPKTNLVIRFSPLIRSEALLWFLDKIKEQGLWKRCEPISDRAAEGLIVHLTADNQKFLKSAESMGIRKPVAGGRGRLQSFTIETIDEFLELPGLDSNNLLTSADKQFIVLHELGEIRGFPSDSSVPGYPLIPIRPGQSIFQIFLANNLILDYFPLHDESELNELADEWISWSSMSNQPFDKIRKYFGDGIGFYFSFLQFYTFSMVIPALCGLIKGLFLVTSRKNIIFFCIVNLFWYIVWAQDVWGRKCKILSQSWGTYSEWRFVRSSYIPSRSSKWGWIITKVVSFGAVIVIVATTAILMSLSLWFQSHLKPNSISLMLWQIADAIIIWSIGYYYKKFASFLTNWENHTTEADFASYRVYKLVQYESVHNFLPLFYFAFWLKDLKLLRQKINRMLLIVPLSTLAKEIVVPLLFRKQLISLKYQLTEKWPRAFCWILCDPAPPGASRKSQKELTTMLNSKPVESFGLQFLEEDDPRIEASHQQSLRPAYDDTFDDYFYLYIEFGYIFLFTGVIEPYAALIVFMSSFMEICTDAFKICKVSRRPFAKRSHDIGPWITAFQFIGALSILSNCAMLSFLNFSKGSPPITPTIGVATAATLFLTKFLFYTFPDHHIPLVFH